MRKKEKRGLEFCKLQNSRREMYFSPKFEVKTFMMSDVLGVSDPDKIWGTDPDNDVANNFPDPNKL